MGRDTRLLLGASGALVALLAASLALQVRPWHWDTYQVDASLRAFDANRRWLLAGAWARPLLLAPLAVLAAWLWRRPGAATLDRAGALLLVGAGVLGAAAGAVATVLGVPAEEYRPGAPEAAALRVLADALFWVQDSLVVMGNVALAAGAAACAWGRRRAAGLPAWAGVASLPLMLAGAASFVAVIPDRAAQPWWYGPWYLAGTVAALAAFALWLTGVARQAARGQATGEQAGASGRRPVTGGGPPGPLTA